MLVRHLNQLITTASLDGRSGLYGAELSDDIEAITAYVQSLLDNERNRCLAIVEGVAARPHITVRGVRALAEAANEIRGTDE